MTDSTRTNANRRHACRVIPVIGPLYYKICVLEDEKGVKLSSVYINEGPASRGEILLWFNREVAVDGPVVARPLITLLIACTTT